MKSSLLGQLADLERLSVPSLRAHWRQLFSSDPPAYGRQLLIRRIAYRIQELAYGGLSADCRRELEKLVHEDGDGRNDNAGSIQKAPKPNSSHTPPGTRIVREWRGRLYEVVVAESGFEFDGACYRSLSAIAKMITSTHWNGPVFFGLREGKRKERHP
jgi:hypothetical protein